MHVTSPDSPDALDLQSSLVDVVVRIYHPPEKKVQIFMRPLSERCVSTFVFKTQRCTRTRRKTSLNFEIHIFFANAFESTLPLPKVRTFNSRWRLLAWLAPLPSIYNANCILSSQNLLLFLKSQHWSSGRRRGFYLPKFL